MEFIPNDRQSSALGFDFPQGIGDSWLEVLKDAEDVLTGDLLLPHWRLGDTAGLNLDLLLNDPPNIDIIGLFHGYSLAPYAHLRCFLLTSGVLQRVKPKLPEGLHMNIHEYQAKALLKSYGAPVSDGRAVTKAEEAKTAAGELDGPLWVVKAQIHAGGRGKGKFKEADAGEAGGVRLAKSVEEAAQEAKKMLGRTLVTHQTGPLCARPKAAWTSKKWPKPRQKRS